MAAPSPGSAEAGSSTRNPKSPGKALWPIRPGGGPRYDVPTRPQRPAQRQDNDVVPAVRQVGRLPGLHRRCAGRCRAHLHRAESQLHLGRVGERDPGRRLGQNRVFGRIGLLEFGVEAAEPEERGQRQRRKQSTGPGRIREPLAETTPQAPAQAARPQRASGGHSPKPATPDPPAGFRTCSRQMPLTPPATRAPSPTPSPR